MPHVDDLEYARKGSGRPLVLVWAAPEPELFDALATRFDVFAFTAAGEEAAGPLKLALERLRVERPLLVGLGAGADAACAVAAKRIPRGVVLVSGPRSVSVPLLVLSPAEASLAGRAADRIAAFDAPLEG